MVGDTVSNTVRLSLKDSKPNYIVFLLVLFFLLNISLLTFTVEVFLCFVNSIERFYNFFL